MYSFKSGLLRDYARASALEWVQTDGVGGVAASSIIGSNTRKQHAMLSVPGETGGRIVLVANLQETLVDQARSFDLSTNAYFGAIHPAGHEFLESFAMHPWPTWTYRFDGLAGAGGARVEKQLVMVHGEHTVVLVYRLIGGERSVSLTVRPMLAFRHHNEVMLERGRNASNWQATTEFIECRPFGEGPTLFIAHPNAKIETVGMWYRGFIYQRDQEANLDCIEDLYNPGSLEIALTPNVSRCLVFSTPSPRSVELVSEYVKEERSRREETAAVRPEITEPLFRRLVESSAAFVYERLEGPPAIHPGLPWGECEIYRGLLAFPGLFLVTGRLDAARNYVERLAALWRKTRAPSRFCERTVPGQMHPADAPLWLFIAAWRLWKTSGDDEYAMGRLVPLLDEIAAYYASNDGEVRNNRHNMIEVGHEKEALYEPHLPLGTNALWFNAQMILSEMTRRKDRRKAAERHRNAQIMVESMRSVFACRHRAGMADAVTPDPFWRDETLRSSQVLTVGLPYCVAAEPVSTLRMIQKHLLTPFGLRTIAPEDRRYVGDGMDVKVLPELWSGSVDATWIGCYCDGLKRTGQSVTASFFEPFAIELERRGVGHISGAYAGNHPHEPFDYVASASAVGEILRSYARHVLRLPGQH